MFLTYPYFPLFSFSPSFPLPHVRDFSCGGSVIRLTTDWTAGIHSPAGEKDFSSGLSVQTSSDIHTAFYPMGTGGPFPGDKARPGRNAEPPPPQVVPWARISRSSTTSSLSSLLNGVYGTALLLHVTDLGPIMSK
jgi:hypothetical protein